MRGRKKDGGKMYAGWEPTLNFIVITSQMGFAGTRGMRVGVLQVQQPGSYLRGHRTERLSNQANSSNHIL